MIENICSPTSICGKTVEVLGPLWDPAVTLFLVFAAIQVINLAYRCVSLCKSMLIQINNEPIIRDREQSIRELQKKVEDRAQECDRLRDSCFWILRAVKSAEMQTPEGKEPWHFWLMNRGAYREEQVKCLREANFIEATAANRDNRFGWEIKFTPVGRAMFKNIK